MVVGMGPGGRGASATAAGRAAKERWEQDVTNLPNNQDRYEPV